VKANTAQSPDISENGQDKTLVKFAHGFTPWLILACVCFGLYCNSLGSWAFMDPGETYYSEAAREMIESGEYIVPHLNYQVYFSKPILTFWITAASYLLFGVSEFSARLPFGLLATLLVFATYYVTRIIAGKGAALLAGLICASAPLLVAHTKFSCIDIVFTTFLNLGAYAFILSVFAGKRLWWLVLWGSLGLGMLTKGPAALLIFAIGTTLYLLLSKPGLARLWFWFKSTKPIFGIPLFFALVVPWYFMVWKATKGLFLEVFFVYENLARFQGKTNMHRHNLFYFVSVLAYGIAPWFLMLPQTLKMTFFQPIANIWLGGKRLSYKSTYRPYAKDMKAKEPVGDDETYRVEYLNEKLLLERSIFYLASWTVAVFVFFSVSKTQLDTYAMPLIAPLSVLMAISMLSLAGSKKEGEAAAVEEKFDLEDQEKWDRLWLTIVLWLICLFSFGAALTLPVLAFGIETATGSQRIGLAIGGLITLLGAAAQLRQLLKKQLQSELLTAALTICVLVAYVHPIALQIYARTKQDEMVKLAGYLPDNHEEIALYGPFKPSLIYYLKRPIDTFSSLGQFVVGRTASGRKQLVFGDDAHMKDFERRPDLKLTILYREGKWAIYELTNGYAARPRSLEESFKMILKAGQSLSATNQFGPLTVPLGGGDADWYKEKKVR